MIINLPKTPDPTMVPKPYSIICLSTFVIERKLVVISGMEMPRARMIPLESSDN